MNTMADTGDRQTEIKDRIARYWNGRAGEYDSHFGHGLFSEQEKQVWLDTLRRNLPLSPGAPVLDVGCGTGFLSLLLAELGFRVTGVDFAQGMMDQARQKATDRGLELEMVHGDAEAPPVEPGSFRAVISRHLLWTLPHPERALANWMDLVAPGGLVVVIDGVWTPRTAGDQVMFKLAEWVGRLKGQRNQKSWEKEYLQNPTDLPLMGGAESAKVRGLFAQVGFQDIRLDDMAQVVRCEKRSAPLEYSLRYALGKSRYLVSGRRPV